MLRLRTFEIKSYGQLNFMLGVVNSLAVSILLAVARYYVLLPDHRTVLDSLFRRLGTNPVLVSLPIIGLSVIVWGWISTTVLRIHDRLHEPRFVKWRAGYDSDYILRSLCYDLADVVSPDLFERSYVDKRVRGKLIQRLFYCFVGDAKSPHEELRMRFYTIIFKYWVVAVVELYSLFSLAAFSAYHVAIGTSISPGLVLVATLVFTICRVYANHVLDEVRSVTSEQVSAVLSDHAEDLREHLINVADGLNARRT